jgi:hypothetical protein
MFAYEPRCYGYRGEEEKASSGSLPAPDVVAKRASCETSSVLDETKRCNTNL